MSSKIASVRPVVITGTDTTGLVAFAMDPAARTEFLRSLGKPADAGLQTIKVGRSADYPVFAAANREDIFLVKVPVATVDGAPQISKRKFETVVSAVLKSLKDDTNPSVFAYNAIAPVQDTVPGRSFVEYPFPEIEKAQAAAPVPAGDAPLVSAPWYSPSRWSASFLNFVGQARTSASDAATNAWTYTKEKASNSWAYTKEAAANLKDEASLFVFAPSKYPNTSSALTGTAAGTAAAATTGAATVASAGTAGVVLIGAAAMTRALLEARSRLYKYASDKYADNDEHTLPEQLANMEGDVAAKSWTAYFMKSADPRNTLRTLAWGAGYSHQLDTEYKARKDAMRPKMD